MHAVSAPAIALIANPFGRALQRDFIHPIQGFMYIDPSAGSLLLQLFAAGVLSAAATIKSVRRGLRSAVTRLLRRDRND